MGLYSRFQRNIDWSIKRLFTWSRRVPDWSVGDLGIVKQDFDDVQNKRAQELDQAYETSHWTRICEKTEVHRCYYTLDVLDQHLKGEIPEGPALDVGAREWWYIPALYSFRPGPWLGVEVDGYQRYGDMTTRAAVARVRCSSLDGVEYAIRSILDEKGRYAFITWFLPFVFFDTQVAGGLPDRFFEPRKMLEHVYGLLEPGGVLFVVNQNQEEVEEQGRLFESLGINAESLGTFVSSWVIDPPTRQGWLVRKPEAGEGERQQQ
jgi:SAM-dependent methyltransferase